MAKKTSRRKKIEDPEYRTKGFQHAHDQAGASDTVTEFLKEEGMITPKDSKRKTAATKKSGKKSTKSKKATSSSRKSKARTKKQATKTKTPPRRRKGRRPCKSRSFRLPLETDDQLQFLTRYYECYMLDVIKVAIHNEWVRATRERQRKNRETKTSNGDAPDQGTP